MFSALVMLIVILFIGPLFEQLPKACLASIIIVAFRKLLMQITDFVKIWKISKLESVFYLI